MTSIATPDDEEHRVRTRVVRELREMAFDTYAYDLRDKLLLQADELEGFYR